MFSKRAIDGLGRNAIVSLVLIFVIGLVCWLLAIKDLATPWKVVLQLLLSVAGAALGNVLRLDWERHGLEQRAKTSIRSLFDMVARQQLVVARLSEGRNAAEAASLAGEPLDTTVAAMMFGYAENDLRQGINDTASAIEQWNDLAPAVYESEVARYTTRHERLPKSLMTGTDSHD